MPDNGGGNDSPLAVDIITYIGVPLTVLGILPILYNTIITLAALSKIKRMLRKSQLTALTRSDVVNRVIEIELPRYAVKPWDRFQQRNEYWSLSRHPSSIPGGSWTTFNWKTNTIGVKTQRIEYADQLRQPQVEVSFDDLVCYLLDLGAKPDAQGWRILRTTGQWTPVGCALLLSPDGKEKALTIAPADDSDGNLSLAVSWSPSWTDRDHSTLPPYWVRLPPPPPPAATEKGDVDLLNDASSSAPINPETPAADGTQPDDDEDLEKGMRPVKTQKSWDSVTRAVESNAKSTITCQIAADGLVNALTEEQLANHPTHFNSLYIEHLRLGRLPSYAAATTPLKPTTSSSSSSNNKNTGLWFAAAITAFGTTSQTVLWNYKIPDSILQFARRDTIPCGVCVQLGMVPISSTPEWATEHDDEREANEAFHARCRQQHLAFREEMGMDPKQRAEAQRRRMQREAEAQMQELRSRQRRQEERAEQRLLEALQSPRWGTGKVAGFALEYLRKEAHVSAKVGSVKDAVGVVLHGMVLDGEFARKVADMLDSWKAWAENGGMRKSDFAVLKEDTRVWAMSVLLVALVSETATALEGTLAMDLQECLGIWKKVRLG